VVHKGKLHSLSVHSDMLLDKDMIYTLRARQNHIQHLELGPILGTTSRELHQLLSADWLVDLQSLVVNTTLSGVHELAFHADVIHSHKSMANLHIRPMQYFDGFGPPPDRYQQTHSIEDTLRPTECSVLHPLSEPFYRLATYDSSPPITLGHLELSFVILENATPVALKMIDFMTLKHLTILICYLEGTMLHRLSEYFEEMEATASSRPQLRSLRYHGDRGYG